MWNQTPSHNQSDIITQTAKQLLSFETQLYQQNQLIQMETIMSIGLELQSQQCNAHYNLVTMLSKFFGGSASLILRIKVVDALKDSIAYFVNEIDNWRGILDCFAQECYSNNYKLRQISLHGLNIFVPIMQQHFDMFHLIYDTFMAAIDTNELQIASITLTRLVHTHHSYSFINKLTQIESVIPSIQRLKYAKYTVLIKNIMMLRNKQLFAQQIWQFQYIIIQQAQLADFTQEMLPFIYQLAKLSAQFRNYTAIDGNKPRDTQQIQEYKQQLIECLQVSKKFITSKSNRIQNLFKDIYKVFNLEIINKQSPNTPCLLYAIESGQKIELSHQNIIKCFVDNYAGIEGYLIDNLNKYSVITTLIDYIQSIFDFTCQQKLVTVSAQIEANLEIVLINLDKLILKCFQGLNIMKCEMSDMQIRLIQTSVQLKSGLDSLITINTNFMNNYSLNQIVHQLTQNPNLRLSLMAIKYLCSINDQSNMAIITNSIQNMAIPNYIQTYLDYLTNLNDYDANLYWSDFQVQSNQTIIRHDIISFYTLFKNKLEQITNITDYTPETASIIYSSLSTLLQDIKILYLKITFFSNSLYAEDALYLQKIVAEKLLIYFARKYLDLELDQHISQDSRTIISKLIQYNKINFIRVLLPNLRSEKLNEFIDRMIQSIHYFPKIMLKLMSCPQLNITCLVKEENKDQLLMKFKVNVQECKVQEDIELEISYNVIYKNTTDSYKTLLRLKLYQGIHKFTVSRGSCIEYMGTCLYQGVVMLSTSLECYQT